MPDPDPEPVQPYLPPAAAKTSGPVTGQVASILVTEPADATTAPALASRRGRLRMVLVAVLLLAIAAAAVVFLSPTS